jgi:hypothetical protein
MFTLITRDEAHAKGLKRYYTGVPCKKAGHACERFVANGGCVECVNRSSPHKARGITASNAGWPPRAMVFNVPFRPTPEEISAAFLYAEAQRYLDYALQCVHNDPLLLAQYAQPLSGAERAQLVTTLERDAMFRQRVAGLVPEPQK